MNAIYPEQCAPTPSCHASTLAEVEGRIIAAWFGGEHENHPEVKIYFAEFTDGIWSTPKIIARGRGPHGEPSACWNPVLFKDPEGPLTFDGWPCHGIPYANDSTSLRLHHSGVWHLMLPSPGSAIL